MGLAEECHFLLAIILPHLNLMQIYVKWLYPIIRTFLLFKWPILHDFIQMMRWL